MQRPQCHSQAFAVCEQTISLFSSKVSEEGSSKTKWQWLHQWQNHLYFHSSSFLSLATLLQQGECKELPHFCLKKHQIVALRYTTHHAKWSSHLSHRNMQYRSSCSSKPVSIHLHWLQPAHFLHCWAT
uniref:Uncharacterized protein n=1 Tax=Oryza glumipatula TaxID=40148 RepID=A0A0D9ZKP9_9ORYZ